MSRMSKRLSPSLLALSLGLSLAGSAALAADFPVTPNQRSTAQKVAEAGVPLSELAPDAPDSYQVKKGDTLWGISKIFLKSPWRWPELWGMNLEAIRNPHLIYPGQMLFLEKSGDRAKLTTGRPVDASPGMNGKLSPRVREEALSSGAIASVPMNLIGPFLNDAVVFETNQLADAPKVVATQEGRVLLSKGETAYVKGNVDGARNWQLFREPRPLMDPETGEVLGFEARHVGTAELVQRADPNAVAGEGEIVPSSFRITTLREEAGLGDRLAPLPSRDLQPYAPHPPGGALSGRIVSVYGDSLNAGQNQIVALNRGLRDGVERGHILALWRAGSRRVDSSDPDRPVVLLPDERHGLLFVFRVFERVSYALILQVQDPVARGDRFTQP